MATSRLGAAAPTAQDSVRLGLRGAVDVNGACLPVVRAFLTSRHVVLTPVIGPYSWAALLSQLTCPISTCGVILPIK